MTTPLIPAPHDVNHSLVRDALASIDAMELNDTLIENDKLHRLYNQIFSLLHDLDEEYENLKKD